MPPDAQPLQHGHHLVDHDGGEAERRLVEHQELGLAHQRLGDRQHLLLAARQDAGQRGRPLGQHGEEIVDEVVAPLFLAAVEARAVEAELEVGVHVLAAEQAAALGDMQQAEIDDAMRPRAGNGLAVEGDGAGRRPQQAGNGAQQGALAGAVAADQGDDRAGRHRKIDASQHADMAVAGVDTADLQQRGVAHDAACPTPACVPM